jgi:AcrR family transcriptional regulator
MSTTTSPDDQRSDDVRSHDPRVERTRLAVIEAAAELLTTDGPSAVTHTSVAAAAKVSRTTVYTHWPTRRDLLRATLDSLGKSAPDVAQLTGVLRDDLAMLCQHIVDDLTDDQRAPMIANMMERALHDPTVAAVRDEFLGAFHVVFSQVIANAVAAGELRPDIDVDRSLATLMGGFLFIRFMSTTTFDDAVARAVIDDFVAVNAPR